MSGLLDMPRSRVPSRVHLRSRIALVIAIGVLSVLWHKAIRPWMARVAAVSSIGCRSRYVLIGEALLDAGDDPESWQMYVSMVRNADDHGFALLARSRRDLPRRGYSSDFGPWGCLRAYDAQPLWAPSSADDAALVAVRLHGGRDAGLQGVGAGYDIHVLVGMHREWNEVLAILWAPYRTGGLPGWAACEPIWPRRRDTQGLLILATAWIGEPDLSDPQDRASVY